MPGSDFQVTIRRANQKDGPAKIIRRERFKDRKHADLFRKNSEGLWVLHPAGEGDVIRLESVGVELALDGLYEDVEL